MSLGPGEAREGPAQGLKSPGLATRRIHTPESEAATEAAVPCACASASAAHSCRHSVAGGCSYRGCLWPHRCRVRGGLLQKQQATLATLAGSTQAGAPESHLLPLLVAHGPLPQSLPVSTPHLRSSLCCLLPTAIFLLTIWLRTISYFMYQQGPAPRFVHGGLKLQAVSLSRVHTTDHTRSQGGRRRKHTAPRRVLG